jgi:hypothetical protein
MGMLQIGIRAQKFLGGIAQLVDAYIKNWYQRSTLNIEHAWAILQSDHGEME